MAIHSYSLFVEKGRQHPTAKGKPQAAMISDDTDEDPDGETPKTDKIRGKSIREPETTKRHKNSIVHSESQLIKVKPYEILLLLP